MQFLSSWAYTLLFGALSVIVIVANLQLIWSVWARNQSHSLILFMGAIFGVIACLCAPIAGVKYFAWVPVVLDPGVWMLLVMLKIKLSLSKE